MPRSFTAGDVAVALVGAARILGANPAVLLEKSDGQESYAGSRTRRLAALALKDVFVLSAVQAARLTGVAAPVMLSPSQVARTGITWDQVAALVVELGGAEPPRAQPTARPPVKAQLPIEVSPPAPVVSPAPPAPAEIVAPKREAAPDRLRRTGCVEPDACRARGHGLCRRCFAKTLQAKRAERRPDRPREPTSMSGRAKRHARRAAADDPRGITMLRALTPTRLRYCTWFLAAGWPPEEVAYLFDVDAQELAA